MRSEYVINSLKKILNRDIPINYNTIYDAIESIERSTLTIMIIDHFLKNGYALFYDKNKIHLVNPLETSLHYEAASLEELCNDIIVTNLTDSLENMIYEVRGY